MIGLRKLHLYIGFALSPFLLLQAVTGFILRTGNYRVLRVHDWQWLLKYIAYALAVGLAFLAVSGAILYASMRIQQWRRKARKAAAPPPPGPAAN